MNRWLALAKALNQTMIDHAPGWTGRNDADPGITMLEVMAYLAEGLRRNAGVVHEGSSAVARTIESLDAYEGLKPLTVRVGGEAWQRVQSLADADPAARVFTFDDASGVIGFGDGVHGAVPGHGNAISVRYRNALGEDGNITVSVRATWPLAGHAFTIALREDGTIQLQGRVIIHEGWSGRKRPRFFPGRLLTASDLAEEQDYHLAKHRHHLQMLHGSGIVHGLHVEAAADGETLTVQPGLAIDGRGCEIRLDDVVTLTLPSGSLSPALIVAEYVERSADPVPVSADGAREASRIEEGFHIVVARIPYETGVAVARVVRETAGWRVDPSFVPPRAR